jgi:8-oxo-dGTP diphosphatase
MQEYCLGFLFSERVKHCVWLMEKKTPAWQNGLINGIGGKLEPGENPYQAMVREFKEEAGLDIPDWNHFCTVEDDYSFVVHCYRAFSNDVPKAMLAENIKSWDVRLLPYNVISNVHWLVPMALNFSSEFVPYKVREQRKF